MRTLFILHGWQSSKEKWEKIKNELEKLEIEVLVPDLPGFKTENELSQSWDLDNYVEWLYRFLLFREKIFLLGHSFGGRIAIKFAAKYPEKLSGLILVSSAGIKEEKTQIEKLIFSTGVEIFNSIFRLPVLNKFKPFFREIFYRYILKKTDYLQTKGPMKKTFKKTIEEDLMPYLSQIKTPTLIIWGENDKITPLKDAFLLEENIKNSKLEILENVGHTPHLERPEKLAEIVTRFLQS